MKIPIKFERIKELALAAIAPIRPADGGTAASKDFLLVAHRSTAGRLLPEYFLLYFLLVDLLGFKNLGKAEKLAWSVPIDYNGQAFLIEHRKLGVGVFVADPVRDGESAAEIVRLITAGVDIAEPFFSWLAAEAVKSSQLNVINQSKYLFDRYTYFLSTYENIRDETERRKNERVEKINITTTGEKWREVSFPAYLLRIQSQWMAQAAIDAFFTWTEHVFIQLAIISGKVTTGSDVAKFAVGNWYDKFARALDVTDKRTREFYEKLSSIKQQLRNFMAHGAFGKRGEAFQFHSGAGAVPVLLTEKRERVALRLTGAPEFEESAALRTIQDFVEFLWSGDREPARLYIQETGLPLILPMASDGTYERAMVSVTEMKQFVKYMTRSFDDAANMDW